MTAPVFVDTNVLLYARDSSEPARQPAAQAWLSFLWKEHAGRISTQVLSEYYFNVTRKAQWGLSATVAWDHVQVLMAWNPQPIDQDVLGRAREIESRFKLNWWDCQIVAAAELQGCSLLLTEDLQDGARYGSVVVRSPFSLSLGEEALPYLVEPHRPVRHRGRGRPAHRKAAITA